ncbi:MAG: 50S ribosomal protein L30 [Anaerolineales bacterium]|nr:50S ribosomal protein L30 [Anaerolineales bacterium]
MAKKKDKMLKLTLVRSPYGRTQPQRRTLEALGLRKINQSVERPDHPSILGMIERVKHLIVVE